ncbi:MAG: NHL repeat-containing protein [Acidobacteriaceae bacterium]
MAVGPLLWVLAGCGGSSVATATMTSSYTGASFAGKVMAGKQPLIGASVQLYAAGTSGNGSSAAALLTNSLTTDANGAFTVPAGYLCPSSASQLYVVARGGKPGAAAASANGATALLTVLGACNQIVASSQVVVNEVTTVAAVYALSQFLSAGANLGASSTNTAGLANAVATAQALADITAGSSPGPSFAANGSSPAPRIDSLANLLNTCTAAAATTPCSALFSATTPEGGSAPSNTLDAVLNLARNPALNVAALYALSAGSSAFAPALAAAPADWTLFVNYTGGGMNGPTGLGVDSAGDVWVASYVNVASLFSPLGKPLLPQGITGSGLSASYGLAVDATNDAWIPNEPSVEVAGNSVSVLNSSGQSVAGSGGFSAGGLDFPIAVAIDTDNSVWVVDYGNSHLTHLSASGQALSGAAGYASTALVFPVAAAIDGSHNVWVANQGAATVTRVTQGGAQFTSYTCCDGPSGLAIDQLGNVWVANYYGNSISEISSSGIVLSNGAYTGGGIDHPQGIAIDGAGDVWIANYRAPGITELAGAIVPGAGSVVPGAALSPSAGLGPDAALIEAYAIAVDASGNLWVSNFGSNTLTQFIGLASPVRTPLLALPTTP